MTAVTPAFSLVTCKYMLPAEIETTGYPNEVSLHSSETAQEELAARYRIPGEVIQNLVVRFNKFIHDTRASFSNQRDAY